MGKDSTSVSSSNSTLANHLYRLILRTATLPIVVDPYLLPRIVQLWASDWCSSPAVPSQTMQHISSFLVTPLSPLLLPARSRPCYHVLAHPLSHICITQSFPSLFPGLFELPPLSTHPPYADCLFTGTLFSRMCLVIAAVTSA